MLQDLYYDVTAPQNGQLHYTYQNYDLNKNINVSVKSLHKHFQFNSQHSQKFPIMISLDAAEPSFEQTNSAPDIKEAAKITKYSYISPGIDLICVLDISQSANREKLKNAKRALESVIELLGQADRFCLILFNQIGNKACPLLTMTETNKKIVLKIINTIQHSGDPKISAGLDLAIKVIQERQFINSVTSIFLLCDGKDNFGSDLDITMKQLSQIQQNFSIYTFGFGQDNDSNLLTKITKQKGGSYYYVQNINQIDEFFAEALGGLFSVVAQEVTIDVQLNFNFKYEKFFKNTTVAAHGDQWECYYRHQIYSHTISQLSYGSKNFIFELNIPPMKIDKIYDFERNVEAANVTIQFNGNNSTNKITKQENLIITLYQENERVPTNSELDSTVEFNYFKVKAAQQIKISFSQAENQNFIEGEKILKDLIITINQSKNKDSIQLKGIKRDIKRTLKSIQKSSEDKHTKNQIIGFLFSFCQQQGGSSLGFNSNKLQDNLVKLTQSHKSTQEYIV